jgi:CxxC motif-containing protein (DUF1111 family)
MDFMKLAVRTTLIAILASPVLAQQDPGLRGGPPGAGGIISGLDKESQTQVEDGKTRFQKVDQVTPDGLGPRFNADSCAACHSQPAIGGTSPPKNPLKAIATANGATNSLPSFITDNGPIREARYISDGGVHDLFVISGRQDASGCSIKQPDFDNQIKAGNVSFRIPTPLFGLGLVENTPDQYLIDDVAAVGDKRSALGIAGHFNYSGNDGTITRFGWKAQNKTLLMFAGEAYNVEIGVTNELFANKREYDANCQYNPLPEDVTDISQSKAANSSSDITMFAKFMQMVAPPTPVSTASTTGGQGGGGQQAFNTAGCNLCHISDHTTAPAGISGLSKVQYFPYSDFQVHAMGDKLQDQVPQGYAAGNEFRTAPLWGVGQRVFFLHDGRTTDLLEAIKIHSSNGSEANGSVQSFLGLPTDQQQAILNFLRSL